MPKRNSRTLFRSLAVGLATALALPGGALAAETCDSPVPLRFTYWGSAFEKKDITAAVDAFNASHPCIRVEGQHIPNAGYVEKITTELASGDPPDIAYLDETQAFPWAAEGKLLDLTPYFNGQPDRTFVKNIVYRAGDHLIGTGLATGVILTYYNKELFDKAGVPYPPAKADEAWSWDEFLANAKKLTKDRAGHDASDPAFDPTQIATYGIAISPHWWGYYLPFIYSAGGKFANDEYFAWAFESVASAIAVCILKIFTEWGSRPAAPTADRMDSTVFFRAGFDGAATNTHSACLPANCFPRPDEPA